MTSTTAIQASNTLLAQLTNPAARALLLGAAAGLGLAAFRVKTTSTRLLAWTAVLYAALAMPVLGWILPPLPIPTPTFLQNALTSVQEDQSTVEPRPAAEQRQNAVHSLRASRRSASRVETAAAPGKPQPGERIALPHSPTVISAETDASSSPLPIDAPASSIPRFLSTLPWTVVAAGIYLAGAMLLLVRFFIGLALARRLARASRRIDDPRITERLASHAAASGLAFIPSVAESEFISVPVTIGALRSMILLPTSWCEWDSPKLDAVLAHELSHLARRDALTQRLSLLHRAIFWFNPMAWWLDRHLANLAEQASDEAALSCGADRKHYARILLEFFEALHASPGRVWWQGLSMAAAGQAEPSQVEQRVERILSWKGSVAMHLKKWITVLVVALAIPVVYLAASANPAQHLPTLGTQFAQDQTPPPASSPASAPKAQPSAAPTSEATPPPEPTPEPEPALAPVAGVQAGVVAPAMPVAPIAPVGMGWSRSQSRSSRSFSGRSSSGHGYSYSYGYDDDQRFVIVTGKSDSLTMSGSSEDARHVEKLRKSIPGDFIWFERDEKPYVIRDQATIDRARSLWAPEEELGKKQEALGKQQEMLGKQQEELGEKMEQIHVNVPDMSAQLDKLKAELKQLSSGATVEQVGHLQEEIGEIQSKIGDIQSHAGDQQGKLGEEMGALGEKQGTLGEQQGKLGEQQAKLAEEATRQMKQLLDEAIKNGKAQPEL
jgi:beta-lactamase regulating signal transducer with metallopeptidase domain